MLLGSDLKQHQVSKTTSLQAVAVHTATPSYLLIIILTKNSIIFHFILIEKILKNNKIDKMFSQFLILLDHP